MTDPAADAPTARPALRRPLRRPPRTVSVTGDVVRVVVLVGCVAVVLAVVWWLRGRATETPAIPLRAPTASDTPVAVAPSASGGPAPAASAGGGHVLVDVRGAVVAPGVRRLPSGSRVIDAVRAAGGLRPGHGYGPVNLAAVLTDGQQVRIGPQATSQPAPSNTAPGAAQPGALLDLNAATEADLELLDGIGPVLAGQIVAWRESNGPFRSVEDLLDVSGIGEATLAGIRDQVTVG